MIKNILIAVLILIVVWQALAIHSDEYIQGTMAEDHGNLQRSKGIAAEP